MFKQNGLSLDQAPPIVVVFRFFFMASIFGIIAGFEILYYQNSIFNPASIGALTLTHTLTLGVMLSFMLGALFQMLPVIAGVVLDYPIKRSLAIQVPFFIGVISLLLAFNLNYQYLYITSSIFLGFSLFSAIFMMSYRLIKIPNHTPSSRGMVIALISLFVTVLLALYLTKTLSGYGDGLLFQDIKNIHIHFGLFGWIGVLIFSIAFQVIEMFYVTPSYPEILGKYSAYLIFLLLISTAFYPILNNLLYLLFISFSLLTLYRLTQKKRKLSDATIFFWRMGLSSLVLSMVFLVIYSFNPVLEILNIVNILFVSFGLSIVFAMLYKIIPFLTWFHLNSQGYFKAPMMHEVIHPKTAKKHFWIHFSTIISLIISIFIPMFIFISGVLVIISFSWIAYQIIHSDLLYKKIENSGEKFEFSS